MDFPFGHNRRHNNNNNNNHEHRRDYEDDEEDYPPPPPNFHNNQPPPSFPGGFRDEQPPPPPHPNFYNNQPPPSFPGGFRDEQQQPPPPPFSTAPLTHHQHRPDYYGQEAEIGGYQQPPPQPQHYQGVQHVSHHVDDRPHHYGGGGNAGVGGEYNTNNSIPSFIHHHQHTSSGSHHSSPAPAPAPAPAPDMINKPTFRVYSKADTGYSLTIRDSQVVLAPSDPRDHFQHWIKDQKFSTRVKDEEGFPCFALVNKATGQAIKHSVAATQPVQLVPYNPNAFDESVLWTESKDLGDSYRCIRMVNNIRLNLDAFNGDKNHGGVHDGTIAVLWEWKKGDNQRWKIAPYCKFHHFE